MSSLGFSPPPSSPFLTLLPSPSFPSPSSFWCVYISVCAQVCKGHDVCVLGGSEDNLRYYPAPSTLRQDLQPVHTCTQLTLEYLGNLLTSPPSPDSSRVAVVCATDLTYISYIPDMTYISNIYTDLTYISYIHTDLTYISYIHTDVTYVSYIHADLTYISYMHAYLSYVFYIHADLTYVSYIHTDLTYILRGRGLVVRLCDKHFIHRAILTPLDFTS